MSSFSMAYPNNVQGVLAADSGMGPIAPGATATLTFDLGKVNERTYFTIGSMVIPSNDAFITNSTFSTERSPDWQIFDELGRFVQAGLTQDPADPRHSTVGRRCPKRFAICFGTINHRSELDQRECLSVDADSMLVVQYRTGTAHFDENSDQWPNG